VALPLIGFTFPASRPPYRDVRAEDSFWNLMASALLQTDKATWKKAVYIIRSLINYTASNSQSTLSPFVISSALSLVLPVSHQIVKTFSHRRLFQWERKSPSEMIRVWENFFSVYEGLDANGLHLTKVIFFSSAVRG
jgi:hypothetical protein